jgi:predicted esterase
MKYLLIISIFLFFGCANQKTVNEKPLLVFLHGYGGNKESLKELSDCFKDNYDIKLMEGFFDLKSNTYSWGDVLYDEKTNSWFERKSGLYSLYKLRDILGKEKREIILIGESQGATMGLALLLNYPEQFKKAVSINGFIDEKLFIDRYKKNFDSLNVLRLNGTNDFIINEEMVNYSTRVLDSLHIEDSLILHNEQHSFTPVETETIKDWISIFNYSKKN